MGSNLSRRVYPDTTSITSKQALLSARTDQNGACSRPLQSHMSIDRGDSSQQQQPLMYHHYQQHPHQSQNLAQQQQQQQQQHLLYNQNPLQHPTSLPPINTPFPESSLDHADTQLTANRIRCLEDDRNKALVDKRRFAVLLSEVETVSATRCELIRGLEAELQAQANALHIQASAISDLKGSISPLYHAVLAYRNLIQQHITLLDPLVLQMQTLVNAHSPHCLYQSNPPTSPDTAKPGYCIWPSASSLQLSPQYPTDLIKPCNTHTVTPDSFNMASPYTTSVEDQKALLLTDTLSKLIADYIQIAARLKASAATTLYSTDEALNADFISLALNDGLDQSANSGISNFSF
ncbi:hypothetical protein BASA50_001802 [Batrachochytrium salamandrivorans]|uniref:Uncharacterized protein n=1 Tax=Batrachochytrium salamandrivorans TaxID=1357716 RepID=A0ABQ8FN44_9FUNG|nr:hypothetical protein BASA60_009880 [Batrachochytrium salamandrivorans]KAH6601124.1 hypothetical protein BASA50_001802 [Batrachochytrium salamandrivorans]